MPPVLPTTANPDAVRAVTYARQSHRHENDSRTSPESQRISGENYIKSQPGWTHAGHFEDVGISGYDPNAYRPGYEDLMNLVRSGGCDVVVVYALSRLTRQGAAEALRLLEELNSHGVALVSVTEPFINTVHDNPFAVSFFALIAQLAHQESAIKSGFVREAHALAREKGGHPAGSPPFYMEAERIMVDGVEVRRLRPNPKWKHVALRAVEMAENGHSPGSIRDTFANEGIPCPSAVNPAFASNAEIGKKLRRTTADADAPAQWSRTSVERMLRDPRLAGFAVEATNHNTTRRTILRDEEGNPVVAHVPLIPPSRWYKLQEILDGRSPVNRRPRSKGAPTLLGAWGILVCGICGAGMTVRRTDHNYVCSLRRDIGGTRHVLAVDITAADDVVARAVWTRIGALDPANDPDDAALLAEAGRRYARNNASPEVEAELASVKAQLAYVQGTLEQVYRDRAEGHYAGKVGKRMFVEQVQKLTAHEESCIARIEELETALSQVQTIPLDEWGGDADDPMGPGSPWSKWSVQERRGFLSIWLDRVEVAPNGRNRRGTVYDRTRNRLTFVWAKPSADEDAAEALALDERQ